jgi:hypothetical protein
MMDKKLEVLSKIEKVDAPFFLDTRIRQKIANRKENNFSPRLTWAMFFSLTLILAVNIFAFLDVRSNAVNEKNIVQSLHLQPQNELYR